MKIPDDWWDPADANGVRSASGEGPALGKNYRGRLLHIVHPEAYSFSESLCETELNRQIETYSAGHEFQLCRACYKLHKVSNSGGDQDGSA